MRYSKLFFHTLRNPLYFILRRHMRLVATILNRTSLDYLPIQQMGSLRVSDWFWGMQALGFIPGHPAMSGVQGALPPAEQPCITPTSSHPGDIVPAQPLI